MPLVPSPKNCDISVKRAIQGICKKLGYTASPTFVDIILTGLTASRLVATDADKEFVSVPGTSVHPEFDGITLKDSGDNIVLYMNSDEFYITTMPTIPITGNPIGLLLALTYTT